jgi:hypothetical protein
MEIRIKILIIVFCSFCGCVSTRKHFDCGNYKNGKYIQYLYNTSGFGHWTKITLNVEKRDSFEIVTREYPISDTAIYHITWVDRCKYNLNLKNPNTDLDSFMVRRYTKGVLHTIRQETSEYLIIKSRNRLDTLWKRIK